MTDLARHPDLVPRRHGAHDAAARAARAARSGGRRRRRRRRRRCSRTIRLCARSSSTTSAARTRGCAAFVARAARLRERAKYDAAYLAQGSVRSGALALARRVSPSASGSRRRRGAGSTRRACAYRDDLHHAARLLLARARANGARADADATRLRPSLYPGAAERAAVDALLGAAMEPDERLIALAPGSVWATKRWPYYRGARAALADARRAS